MKYHWQLSDGGIADMDMPHADAIGIAANEVFDIKPVEGLLHPGSSESVRITYSGKANMKAHAFATMHVQGGPDTHVTLQAKASKVLFQLEPRMLKCGHCQYDQVVQRDVTIMNPSMCASFSRCQFPLLLHRPILQRTKHITT